MRQRQWQSDRKQQDYRIFKTLDTNAPGIQYALANNLAGHGQESYAILGDASAGKSLYRKDNDSTPSYRKLDKPVQIPVISSMNCKEFDTSLDTKTALQVIEILGRQLELVCVSSNENLDQAREELAELKMRSEQIWRKLAKELNQDKENLFAKIDPESSAASQVIRTLQSNLLFSKMGEEPEYRRDLEVELSKIYENIEAHFKGSSINRTKEDRRLAIKLQAAREVAIKFETDDYAAALLEDKLSVLSNIVQDMNQQQAAVEKTIHVI